ncbi:unnamed protein product [Rodentolepis nana]|uniref:DNA-directed RNA polymerase I subunit RPA43 n=1 Tax=Rodentolepis nana TaxID=102285 RepID=A0A0R3TKQ7_RODNA|nr:unnamed protein product [Rodentolepis nana]
MKDVQWNLSVTMNPLQLSDPRTALESYLKPFMNKYIPELKGILLKVDYQTLKLKSSYSQDKPGTGFTSCIIKYHPIYLSAKVNFVINATILCPTVGQQVDADVRVVKFGRLVCRFGDDYSIFVTVPTHGEEAAASIPVDPQTNEPLKLFVGDKVRLEITHVNISVARDVLRLSGRVLSVISRSEFSQMKMQSRNRSVTEQTSIESAAQEKSEEGQEIVSKKRKKHKKHVEAEEEERQPQEIAEEVELEEPPRKKRKRNSEAPDPPKTSEMEAESMPLKKKEKKSRKEKKKKYLVDNLLPVKHEPNGAANESEEQVEEFFQVSEVVNTPMQDDSVLKTGMQSPDIFSSGDE